MASPPRRTQRLGLRLLAGADSAFNRLYGWRGNPLYQSGTIAIALLLVLIVTGLWLIFFYRVGAPYESVARITADPWIGRWVRGTHRYASDLAMIAIVIHAFRMFAQGRSWGPRALAWMTGVVMTGLVLVVGLTGYVMVWDGFGYLVAREGARMMDSLPFLSEPISRAFTGNQDLLTPFFFLNLFAHIAIPLGIALVLWLHVSKVARPVLLPPRKVTAMMVGALVALSIIWPVGMQPAANPFVLDRTVVIDVFFGFWLPLVRPFSGGLALLILTVIAVTIFLLPVITRRHGPDVPPASVVDEDICVGCEQCAKDCPYDAIAMIEREPGGRSVLVARVDPDLCVSCGICAGSCAPMAVGPTGRTGRNQLDQVREFMAVAGDGAGVRGRHVVVCCERGAQSWGSKLADDGALLYPVDCSGSVHTSVIELLVRGGSAGVLVMSCPPRDCWNREGPTWLMERMYEEREAELKERVDRQRVRVAHAGAGDSSVAVAALRDFIVDTAVLDSATAEPLAEVEMECLTADALGGAAETPS